MHPAYSVIVFTCASGAGYGMLVWLGVAALAGTWGPRSTGMALAALGLSFFLVTIGLLSSTLHLGRPERAWRAFSQWRSSWLSREGVMALVTYAVGGMFALVWLLDGHAAELLVGVLGLLTVLAAVATLWCTGMIYASLTTIRAWNHRLVAPLYVLLGLTTGRVVLNAIAAIGQGGISTRAVWLTLLLLMAAWIAKTIYWSGIDEARRTHTVGEATGLGRFGRVRPLDPPHTQANFVMREMGYQVARKHAEGLRQIAALLLFVGPVVLTLMLLLPGLAVLVPLLAVLAALAAAAGVLVERWLFFAEAEHVSMLYYGRDVA
jgi:DMSO reductase anchor subunit